MTQPTAGPWRVAAVSHSDKMTLVGSNFDADAEETKNGGMWIAQCIGPDRDANAKLIAASRDLVEVAKDVAKLPCSTFGHEDMESGCCPSCRARQALIKAFA